MKIDDRRKGEWEVVVHSKNCPHLTYPNIQIACRLLDCHGDNFCYKENCPRVREDNSDGK